ncbi:hypothetical protein RJ641_009253 [Dillenia turbinata]|uniref:Uncharacterized protein n=1 Tax=Dillenia turbinata TaxID=194707 RepID=A0AAN8VCL8_9MAGN
MVAISLYRGNLHRVPDVPRRWLMPNHSFSLKTFRSLLHRRSKALSLIATTSSPIPNPNPNPNSNPHPTANLGEGAEKENNEVVKEMLEPNENKGVVGEQKLIDDSHAENVGEAVDGSGGSKDLQEKKQVAAENPNPETTTQTDESNDKEKRKKEIEEKLQVLNEKKHNLVQVLKQVLNAEEELKRRNSMQGSAVRPPVPLQVEIGNDSGSMSRQTTPKMGSESNPGGDIEGGETDDASIHSMHSRHLLRMSSTSPSSESPLRRPVFSQHNAVSHSRASLAAAGSPSRFAPTGHQTHPPNLPAVSVSGTSYIASSPSPAASGGTSVFRDARLPSPWN